MKSSCASSPPTNCVTINGTSGTALNLRTAIEVPTSCNGANCANISISGVANAENPVVLANWGSTSVAIYARVAGALGNGITLATNNNSAIEPNSHIGSGSFSTTLGNSGAEPGTDGQPSVIAFDNLYSGCTAQSKPTVYWAFVPEIPVVVTSVVLSDDGSQMAFVAGSNLVLLKWSKAVASRTVTDAVRTNGSYSLTSATANFVNSDFGKVVNGTNIPANTFIGDIVSSTQVLLSNAATGSATGTIAISQNIANPAPVSSVLNSGYRVCPGPCYTTLPLGTTSTNSSPFYDYSRGSDQLYVGDDAGKLHKFTGVFNGTPAEVGGAWPVTVSSGNKLTSPVYDGVSGLVFVGDAAGHISSVTSGGTVVQSAVLSSAPGIVDAPLVDSAAGRVYVFAPKDDVHIGGDCTSGHPCASVYQFETGFAGRTSGSSKSVGVGGANPLYAGAFDNIYLTSPNEASPTGNLYVCGNNGEGIVGNAALFKIPISSNVMGAPVKMATAASTAPTICSPVTEFLNGSTDSIFMSVQASGNTDSHIGCPAGGGGCVMAFDVSSGTIPTTTSAKAGEAGGTSGIVIDNAVQPGTLAGASQVYFSTLTTGACTTGGNGGCAVQASQSGLN